MCSAWILLLAIVLHNFPLVGPIGGDFANSHRAHNASIEQKSNLVVYGRTFGQTLIWLLIISPLLTLLWAISEIHRRRLVRYLWTIGYNARLAYAMGMWSFVPALILRARWLWYNDANFEVAFDDYHLASLLWTLTHICVLGAIYLPRLIRNYRNGCTSLPLVVIWRYVPLLSICCELHSLAENFASPLKEWCKDSTALLYQAFLVYNLVAAAIQLVCYVHWAVAVWLNGTKCYAPSYTFDNYPPPLVSDVCWFFLLDIFLIYFFLAPVRYYGITIPDLSKSFFSRSISSPTAPMMTSIVIFIDLMGGMHIRTGQVKYYYLPDADDGYDDSLVVKVEKFRCITGHVCHYHANVDYDAELPEGAAAIIVDSVDQILFREHLGAQWQQLGNDIQ